jgi:hypothetical protein
MCTAAVNLAMTRGAKDGMARYEARAYGAGWKRVCDASWDGGGGGDGNAQVRKEVGKLWRHVHV